MKRLLITVLVWALTSPFLFSQSDLDRPVTVAFEDFSPYQALLEIETAGKVPFSFNSSILPTGPVSGNWKNTPLREVLSEFLVPQGLQYTYQDGIVIILAGNRVQRRYTLSGYIEDGTNGERLIGASVYDARTGKGAITNEAGFFSLHLPPDSIKLVVSMVGYDVYGARFQLSGDMKGTIQMLPNLRLDDVEINPDEDLMGDEFGGASSVTLDMSEIDKLPALMGESDALAALSLLPGVHSGPDGTGGLYVRGGGPEQNLVLYDGVPIYNSSHLFGFYSIFNSSAIKDIELVKGGFPARYGGRLSSVINIRMKEGNQQEWEGEGNIGLTSGRFALQGPLVREKLSVVLAGRRTLLEPYMAGINQISEDQGGNSLNYDFYDLHGKLNWSVGNRDQVFLTAYRGMDDFQTGYALEENGIGQNFDFDLKYGNQAAILRWHRDWSPTVFSDVSVYTTQYQYISEGTSSVDSLGLNPARSSLSTQSDVLDYGARLQIDWIPSNSQLIRVGGQAILHEFSPETLNFNLELTDSTQELNTQQPILRPIEGNIFLEDLIQASDWLSFNVGGHASFFQQGDTTYSSIQPRVSFRLGPEKKWNLTGSYSLMTQFQHLLSNSGLGPPVDLFVPATDRVPPQTAQQFSLGYFIQFPKQKLQFSVEGYFKDLRNLIDYDTDVNTIGANSWQELVARDGTGESYGLEFFLRKSAGRFRGFAGYTWSRTTRQFPTLNEGEEFPYKYDLRHDFSLSLIYEIRKNLEFSANWKYTSGINQTYLASWFLPPTNQVLPLDVLNVGDLVLIYSDRNAYRLPDYHRLDINLRMYKQRTWGETFWNFGLYNAYNRRNAYFLLVRPNFSEDPNNPVFQIRRLSLLPILPSVNFGFKF